MNKIKVNFYRFVDTITEEIEVIQGKNDIPKVQNSLQELKQDAESAKGSLSKMMDSLVPSSAAANLKTMRNATKSNIVNLLKEAENYIKNANASDKFKLQIKAEQDKFAVLDKATDYRTKSTPSEVNKFTGVENRVLKAMNTETAQQEKLIQNNISALKKQFDAEEKNRLAQEKMNVAVKQENSTRSKTSTLMTEFSGGMSLVSQGILSISNGSKSFLKHITGVAVTFRILGGVASGVVDTFKNLYDTAASYEEAVNLYRTALGKYAEEADQWATKISTALHLDPKDVMQYTGALYNLVQGLGVGEDAAYTMATNMTQLSYDMSSFLNIDVQSAYDKIQSAITGQSRAVANAGVALQQASLQELAYSMGIKKSVSEMSQAEKTYLRYIQLMRSTTDMQQDLGKTILTPENALRVLRAEFVQFARALGQVVIPVVLKVIPYLTALANMLTEVARSIAKAFGFEMTKIDYSSFDTGNDKLKSLNKNLKDTGTGAKKAGKEIQRSLAPFDELNVVENETKTGGGIGSGGGGASVLPNLEEYVTGYDMLGKLTKDFDKKVAEARANLEKMIPVIKKIAVAFGLWKLAEKIAGFSNLISTFKIGIKEGTGFGGVIKTLSSRFAEGYRYATAWGSTGLTAIQNGIQNMLGPFGMFVTTIGTMVTAFVGANTIMKNWNGEADNMLLRIFGSAGLVAGLTAITGIFIGPWAAVGVAIAGVVGGLAGLEQALARERLEAEKQAGFPELFENQGIAISGAYKLVEDGIKDVTNNASALQTLVDANDEVQTSWNNAKEAFEDYQLKLSNGEITYSNHKELVNGVTTAVDKLKQAGIDRIEAEKTNELKALDILKEETGMTEQEYKKRKKEITEYYDLQSAQNNGYYDQYKKLLIQREEGTLKEEAFAEKVKELQKEYLGLNTVTEIATEKAKNYLEAQNGKIDLEDPQKFNEIIKTAIERRKEYIDQENNSHGKLIEDWKGQVDAQQKIIDTIEEQYGAYDTLDKKQKDQYDNAKERIDTLSANIKSAEEAQASGVEEINSTYKNFLSSLLLELAATGADQSETFKGSISEIDKELQNIGKDVDPSKSAVDFMGKYAKTMIDEGKTFSAEQVKTFKKYGIDISSSFGDGLISEFGKASINYENTVDSMLNSTANRLGVKNIKNGETVGKDFGEGYKNGINKFIGPSQDAGSNLADKAMGALQTKQQSHSPSKLTMSLGNDFGEGYANGIENQISKAESAAKLLASKAAKALQDNQLSINFSTNIENSLNSMLTKLQKFCTNWKNAINKLASGMKSTMNSIKIDKDGKVTYNSMPDIKVSKFEKGGYPKSGDFFWANENGKAEYIASIGNRTAVANQDQMVSALSGAILTAMSQIPVNSQPSNIVVNVGDKKLYEGQGEYQNRQNDRYGTTVVKI